MMISVELLADTLSDVPDDADSDSENDSDSSIIGNRQNKIVHPLPTVTLLLLEIDKTKLCILYRVTVTVNKVQTKVTMATKH